MAISDKLYRMLPESLFIKLRNTYRFFHKKYFPALDESRFNTLLYTKLRIEKGDTLFIHSSIDKLNLGFSFLRILPLLREAVGEEGTLVFPCWQFNYRAEEYLKNESNAFNVKRSSTVMGLLPELVRKLPGAQRSLHPFNSIVAIGKHANYIIQDHHKSTYPSGEMSPFYRVKELGGKVIGLGERIVSLSFVHTVEDVMLDDFPEQTLTDRIYNGRVIDEQKNELLIKTKAPHIRIKHRDITGYFKKNISSDACSEFRFLGANYFVADTNLLFNEMHELARQGITIYTK